MSNVVTIIVGLLTVAAVAGATVAVARSAYAKATIEELKGQNDVLREGNADCKARVAALEDRAEALERENSTLRTVVTGKTELSQLQADLRDHHREALSRVDVLRDDIRALIAALDDGIGQVLGMLADRRGGAHDRA